jgi:hypothetical protein
LKRGSFEYGIEHQKMGALHVHEEGLDSEHPENGGFGIQGKELGNQHNDICGLIWCERRRT